MARRTTLRILAAALLTGLVAAITAQPAAAQQGSVFQDATFDLAFPGGTVTQYVEAINKAAGGSRIVVRPSAASLEAPPVRLTGVNVGHAAAVLDGLTELQGETMSRIYIRDVGGVFIIGASSEDDRRLVGTHVWSIQHLIGSEALPADDVLAAVETALAVFPDPADVRFHVETGILIARAPEDQLEAIDRVLDAIEQSVESIRDERARREHREEHAADLAQVRREAEFRMRSLQLEIDEVEAMLHAGHAELDELEALAERGNARRSEIDEARIEIQRLENRRELLQLEMENVYRERERFEERDDRGDARESEMRGQLAMIVRTIDENEQRMEDLEERLRETSGADARAVRRQMEHIEAANAVLIARQQRIAEELDD